MENNKVKVYIHSEYTPKSSEFASRNEDTFTLRDYYKSYSKGKYCFTVCYNDYYKIARRIFQLICEEILKGQELTTPFGAFKIWRSKRKKKTVDYPKTTIARIEHNNPKIVVYRTNEDYCSIEWDKAKNIKEVDYFSFDVSKLLAHQIPKYSTFHLNVPHKA